MKNPPCGGSVTGHSLLVQKLYIVLSSASISRDRFLSPSRYCGVKTSFFDSCSSFDTTDKRELLKRVSILWTLFRSRVKSSIAMVASHTGGLWLGLRSRYNADAARFFFRGDCGTWQGKSELPNKSESCPINSRKRAVIRQSHTSWLCPQSWPGRNYFSFTGLILALAGSKRESGGCML
jgi:hypothetical protein